jgi:Zn-dependent metalloprotease
VKVPIGKRILIAVGVAAALSFTGLSSVQAQQASSDSDIVRAAQAAVAANPSVFGFGPGQALQPNGVFTSDVGSAVRFNRTYQGLPVQGGDLIVHLTPSGAFSYGNGLAVSAMPASIAPTVAESSAIAAAANAVSYPVAASSAALVVLASPNSSPLAWKVSTRSADGQFGDATFISATTGDMLASWPTVQTDTGIGRTMYSGKVTLKTVKAKRWRLQDKSRGDQKIYDAHSQDITSGTLFHDRNNKWGNYNPQGNKTAGADAAYALSEVWDYFLETYDRLGIADDGVAARGFVHVYQNWVNASWDDSCFCMRFGDGTATGSITPLVSLDVAGHEMSHGVTSRTAGLVYSGESGGMNEATSDIFGSMVEFFTGNEHDVADYVIGEEIFADYDPATNYIRRMDHPSLDGGSKDCWYAGVGGVDVHYSSGIGNHFFYLLSEGSGAKTINGIDYDSPTCNGATINGIGRDKAELIWYKALTEEWTSTSDYHDARQGTLNAAKALYGAGSTEHQAVNAAWAAVDVTP